MVLWRLFIREQADRYNLYRQEFITKKNLSGYTVKIKMFTPRTIGARFDKTATIVSASGGTWEYAVQEGEMPIFGMYLVKAELTKSGVRESTLNHVEFQVLEGSSG